MASVCCNTIATCCFTLFLIVSLTCHVSSSETNYTFEALDEIHKMKMIKEYLQKINKPAEKTIMSPDGDIIDCILFHKQPGFDHPLLKGKISMEQSKKANEFNSTDEVIENFQLWNINGEKCPEGTIPIKRITEEDILRADSLARFGMKSYTPFTTNDDTDPHEYAIAYAYGTFFGAKATLNIWAPRIANPLEFSSSQIWVFPGQFEVGLNSIEVGSLANSQINKDDRPRLFVSWTTDNYKATGCFNLACPGFIQTNSRIVLGGTFSPVSTYNGDQYEYAFSIQKDPSSGNWYLYHGTKEEIGYWPSHLFNHPNDSANTVQFGGQVLNLNPGGLHTTTQMGSGHVPQEGFMKAAYVRGIEARDAGNIPIPNLYLRTFSSRSNCYFVESARTTEDFGTYFYFGGPGLGENCR